MPAMNPSPQALDVREDDIALGHDAASLRRYFIHKLFFELAKFPGVATRNDHYMALAYVVRDRLLQRWVRSARTYLEGSTARSSTSRRSICSDRSFPMRCSTSTWRPRSVRRWTRWG
jgi:hypothetical protein